MQAETKMCSKSYHGVSALCSQSCSHTELNEWFLPQPLNFSLQWVHVTLLNKLFLRKCELCPKCSDACLATLASPDYESPLLGLNELEFK